MDEIQAAFLSVKLKYLERENEQRRNIAEYYTGQIRNPNMIPPSVPDNVREHVWHLFVIRTPKRDALQKYLLENGIQTLIHYPVPPHIQNAYKEWQSRSYPLTEQIHAEALSLPIGPTLSESEISTVTNVLNAYKP